MAALAKIMAVGAVNQSDDPMAMSNMLPNVSGADTSIEFDTGHMAWLLSCVSITWLMIPGVGFLYSGLTRGKSSLVLLMWCFWTVAAASIQWYLIGYSLCLSNTGNPFIGNVDHAFFWGLDHTTPSALNPKIPALLVGIWYCLFAAITPTIIIGAVVERARLLPGIIFTFCWSTLVFDVLTYWTWNPNGWTNQLGSLDFGGGTPVHISTGCAALAYALLVGKRTHPEERPPHNMTQVVLGTSFIWLGWLVANAGSDLAPNSRTVTIFIVTNLSASVGGFTWVLIDYWRGEEKKLSASGFCVGMICGLVAVTPASGYVSPASSLAFGFAGAAACNFSMGLKKWLRIDDTFDVFCAHGIGGMVGNLLTGVFTQKYVAAVDGIEIEGGWLDGNWKQVGIQAIDTIASGAWAFVMTYIILFVIDHIPGLQLRAEAEAETKGLDVAELGEANYQDLEDLKAKVARLEILLAQTIRRASKAGVKANSTNCNEKENGDVTNGVVAAKVPPPVLPEDDENGIELQRVRRVSFT